MTELKKCCRYNFLYLWSDTRRTLAKGLLISYLVIDVWFMAGQVLHGEVKGFPAMVIPVLYGLLSANSAPVARESQLRKFYCTVFIPGLNLAVTLTVWLLMIIPYILILAYRGFDMMFTATVVLLVTFVTALSSIAAGFNAENKILFAVKEIIFFLSVFPAITAMNYAESFAAESFAGTVMKYFDNAGTVFALAAAVQISAVVFMFAARTALYRKTECRW